MHAASCRLIHACLLHVCLLCNLAGSFESWASDIEHLLDEQQVDKAVFLGMSGGGPFACACARYLPHRTAALVTVSSMTETNSPAAAPLQQQMHWMNRMHCKIIGEPQYICFPCTPS
jgi:pimeloyl-ACP methyl ester carboxylesterase